MKAIKVHSYNGKKAYYAKFGRKWIVEKDSKEEKFSSIEEMIQTYPDLLNVTAIKLSFEKRQAAREEQLPPPIVRHQEVHSKSVTCYYCTGSGEIVGGVPCPNCNGKGTYVVSTRGLG